MHCRLLKASLLQQQVTAILYANPHWAPAHGGELRLWLPPDASDRCSSEGALPVISAAPEQHNNGCPATDECAAPDRLNNATALAPALDDRDGLDNASASAATPSNHATTDHHDSEFCFNICDKHAATDNHSCGSVLAAAHEDCAAPSRWGRGSASVAAPNTAGQNSSRSASISALYNLDRPSNGDVLVDLLVQELSVDAPIGMN